MGAVTYLAARGEGGEREAVGTLSGSGRHVGVCVCVCVGGCD